MADFTIADVLAWARTKPAGAAYDFQFTGGCALCQFLNETGRTSEAWVTYREWADNEGPATGTLAENFNHALGYGVPKEEWTFGGLVTRLEALCPEAVVTPADWTRFDTYLTDIDAVSADKLAPAHIQPHTV